MIECERVARLERNGQLIVRRARIVQPGYEAMVQVTELETLTMKTNPALSALDRAIGTWIVTGFHPYLPGRTLRGRVMFEPIEDGAFLRMHLKMHDPEIPEGIAIFGTDDADNACTMLYFDARGVARRYNVALGSDGFTWSRDAPQFAQRFRVTIAKDGRTMEGEGTMKRDGAMWEPDLRLAYVRVNDASPTQ